jgi:putative endonuclease
MRASSARMTGGPRMTMTRLVKVVSIIYGSVMTAWVYIMTNRRNGTLYIGVTASLAARVWQHKTGSEPSFTRRYGLSQLVYAERHEEMIRAIQREKTMKHWPRAWKIAAIEGLNPEWTDLSGSLSLEG